MQFAAPRPTCMQSSSHISEALKSLMTGAQFNADLSVTDQDVEDLIRSGLGPIFYHVLSRSDRLAETDKEMKLKASDITSRVMAAEQFRNTEAVIEILQSIDIEPVLLKGASFATRYYPDAHLRIMGDVDLLLPPHRIEEAQDVLVRDGFKTSKPAARMDYETHIHSAPLFHPDRNLWVELHRRLLPDTFSASQETPLNLTSVDQEVVSTNLGELDVRCFRTEFELVYLAAGWCYDLKHGFGYPGLRRSLFDCTLVLKDSEGRLNWDDIIRWSKGTLLGASVYILLSFLKRIGVFADSDNYCEILGKQQSYVNAVSLRLMHRAIERHLVHFGGYGRLTSPLTTSNMFDALIRKHAAWRNLAAVPGNILFPRREPQRFSLNYQIGRLQRVLGRGR